MKLTDYMKKVENIYKNAAPKFIEAAQEANAARDAVYTVRNNKNLTPQGQDAQIARLAQTRKESETKMQSIAREAKAQALAVRQEVAERFYIRYHADPASIDTRAMELLKSGILTDREILHLAEGFKGNNTMQRICGKYLEQSKNAEMSRTGRALQLSLSDPHLRCIDSIIEVGEFCMGNAPLSGNDCPDVLFSRFDEMTAQTYATAPDIE